MLSQPLRPLQEAIDRRKERLRTSRVRRGAILLYHRVADPASDPWQMAVSPENFAAHMAIIRRRREARPLSELSKWLYQPGKPENAITVTFDDGYVDNVRTALPILEREQVPATVYVVSGAVGKPDAFWWDFLNRVFLEKPALPATLTLSAGEQRQSWHLGTSGQYDQKSLRRAARWAADFEPPRDARQRAFLNVWAFMAALNPCQREQPLAQLAEWAGVPPTPPEADLARPVNQAELDRLAKSPLIEIGGHTVTHPDLGQVVPATGAEEIRKSRETLRKLTGQEVSSFAYPFGRFGEQTGGQIAAAGYTDAGCSRFGLATHRSHRFRIPRIQVPNISGDRFEKLLNQALGA